MSLLKRQKRISISIWKKTANLVGELSLDVTLEEIQS